MKNPESTERRALETALSRLAAIVESSDDAIIGKDLNGIITSWNQGAEKIFGYTAREMEGTSILRLFPPERQEEENYILGKIRRGEKVEHFETLRRTKDGRLINISVTASPIKDAAGNIIGASKIARDITVQKTHEQEILRLSRLYDALSQVNQAIVWTRNRDELLVKVCRVLVELGKFSVAWIGQPEAETQRVQIVARWGDKSDALSHVTIYADDRPEGQGPTGKAIRTATREVCNDFINETTHPQWPELASRAGLLSAAAFPIWHNGKVWGALTVYSAEGGFFRDKEVALLAEAAGDVSFALDSLAREQALRENEERYRGLFDRSLDCVFLHDFAGKMLDANKAALDLLGYQHDDIATLSFASLLSEDQLPRAFQLMEEIMTTGRQTRPAKFRLRCKDGRLVEMETQSSLIYREGKPFAIQGIARDLTAHNLALEKLRHSEAGLAEAQRIAKVGSWETIVATGAVTWSEETHRIFATDPETFHPTHAAFLQLVHPDDRAKVDQALTTSLATRERGVIEHRLRTAQGEIKIVEERWQIFCDERHRPVRAVGTCQDITERKQAETALQESEEKFRTIFEQAGIGIAMVGVTDGRILNCNHALAGMLGRSRDELRRLTVEEISFSDDYVDDRTQWMRVVAGEIPRFQMEKRYRHKDGSIIWGLLTSTVVRDAGGTPQFVIGMVEAIAERKRAESELRASEQQLHALVGRLNTVREEEAKRIARELHDDLGQQLTALNMGISHLLSRPVSMTPNLQDELVQMRTGVDRMIESVQKIAGELRLGQLDLLGLSAAIETELREFERRSGLRCIITRLDEVAGLGEAGATAVFRIMQEALTNIARHAGADRVELSLRTEPGQLHLEVRDNGRGITTAQLVDRQAFGLLGMRERTEMLGGKFTIAGNPGQGTVIQINLPVPSRN